jgi:LacI family transcriptional regulator
MTSLKELSERLGLSRTQVSRALNGFPDVSEATRRRVEAAARDLGYRPNVMAQRLRSGRSGIVGLVVPERNEQEESNILVEVLLGLATAFWARGCLVVLNVLPDGAETAEAYVRLARDGALDGFVVLNPGLDDGGLEALHAHGVPFVTHGRHARDCAYPFVDLDNRAVGETLAGHLAALGHRRIALIDGPADQFFALDREEGVRRALMPAGGSLDPALVHRGLMTEQLGERAVRRLFAGHAAPPTALIAGNMVVATGAVRALAAAGLRIPRDISVVAHDDELRRYPREALSPLLTGTRSAFSVAWERIVEALFGSIAGHPVAGNRTILAPDFMEGASTAPPRA